MDAPTYPPATAFAQPRRLPGYLSGRETPIAVLKTNPAAWAIVLKEIPNIDQRVSNEQIKPHLGNFSVQTLTLFGIIKPEVVDRLDVALKTLGEVK